MLLPKTTATEHAYTEPTRPHIVVVIPRGEVVRNFVYTGALDTISERSQLSLLSVIPGAEIDRELRERYESVYPLHNYYEEPWVVHIQREVLDIAHNRWIWSKAAQHRWNMREVEAATIGGKSKRIAKKTLSLPFANRKGLELLGKIERTSSKLLNSDGRFDHLYRKIRPTLVFNGSHVHSANATQAIQAAQWAGIPTATFIFSWDNLTSQGRIMLPYDFFLVWNDELRRQLLEMYDWIRPERVFVTGTPQFDFHFRKEFYWTREEFCRSVGADPNRPIILYTTGMANHMPGEPQIVEEIADILSDMNVSARPQLLVRVYPKDQTGRFDELRRRRSDILFPRIEWEPAWLTPKPDDSFALVNCLRHCSLGINIASTVSLELCMFDKPVINIGFQPKCPENEAINFAKYYDFDHYKPLVEKGAVEVAWRREDLRSMIEENLHDPSRNSNKRRSFCENMFGDTLDGNSSGRVADILVRIAAGELS